jgi:hypothetical protein
MTQEKTGDAEASFLSLSFPELQLSDLPTVPRPLLQPSQDLRYSCSCEVNSVIVEFIVDCI